MPVIAGVDIGNSTTEVCVAYLHDKRVEFIASSSVSTSGIKGTGQNIKGVKMALHKALEQADLKISDLDQICLNEATPVISEMAMSTIAETIITESAMIGHNPQSPGGLGLGLGETILIEDLITADIKDKQYIVIIPKQVGFDEAAKLINAALDKGIMVMGAIAQKDEGVLIVKRLRNIIPIVDEVLMIERVPLGMPAAVEVAAEGRTISTLSNPYGIAAIFGLDSQKTKMIAPMAISLIGNRSGVVIKTPEGSIKERVIPAGKISLIGNITMELDINQGADNIMQNLSRVGELKDVTGEAGSGVGGMLWKVKHTMEEVSKQPLENIKIRDVLAVDTVVNQKVKGGIAGEYSLNKAVILAAMVWTDKSVMQEVTFGLQDALGIPVHVEGVEVLMSQLGARTTQGISLPVALVDIGAGSTDVAWIHADGSCEKFKHLAGAGDLVTMIINSELNLNDMELAEKVKRCPAAKVESMFHIRLEDGTTKFFSAPLPANIFGRLVVLDEDEMIPLPQAKSLEQIRSTRQNAKKSVFVKNVLRGLISVVPGGNLHTVQSVIFVGGSSLDYEAPQIISEELLKKYGIVSGSANIRSIEGPRNAVATGIVLSYAAKRGYRYENAI